MADIDNSYLAESVPEEIPAGQPSGTLPVKNLDLKHPEYKALRQTWYKLSLLYAGGWCIKQQAELFLTRRPKEISDVYQARMANFTYQNHLGTALDWYASELFEEDPHIEATSVDEKTGNRAALKMTAAQNMFYDRFFLDCDRAGTSFVDTFRRVFSQLLLFKKSYVLMDLPSTDPETFPNRRAQMDAKVTDPYLCVFSPLEA